jgi:hypothetical protein
MANLTLLRRAWLHLQAANLRWNISSCEAYMAACERDGIMETDTLRYWRDAMAAERVELATIERALDREPMPAAQVVLVVLIGPTAVGVTVPAAWALLTRWNGG